MPPPPVTIYITSLTSHPTVRSHTDLLHRALKGNKIPYEAFDLVMDEAAKTRWQRAKPAGKPIGLPGYLVGGEWMGTMEEFEEAVECGNLREFLKQDKDLAIDESSMNKSDSVTQAELDELMKGMSDGDLEALAGELDQVEPPRSVQNTASAAPSTKTDIGPSHPSSTDNAPPRLATAGLPSPSSVPLGSRVSSPDDGSTRSKSKDRKSKEDLARQMAEAGTMDSILAAMQEADGR
ncbi:hypothetical protein BD324DRAFT_638473 [Kockovaella imperatae]|uniref:Uncharacterized protein n=1 Tax=Kockovaella imperatae TaxID=4999 RepID=A0A1Y1U6U1_9TREE|nr:hypothetical protein BD324DRAFT_638473 [Kockovaella imperatae]ORX33759.1 hypothetical protein BD324DRAFT_638473 [Kockovaella imperatae]